MIPCLQHRFMTGRRGCSGPAVIYLGRGSAAPAVLCCAAGLFTVPSHLGGQLRRTWQWPARSPRDLLGWKKKCKTAETTVVRVEAEGHGQAGQQPWEAASAGPSAKEQGSAHKHKFAKCWGSLFAIHERNGGKAVRLPAARASAGVEKKLEVLGLASSTGLSCPRGSPSQLEPMAKTWPGGSLKRQSPPTLLLRRQEEKPPPA